MKMRYRENLPLVLHGLSVTVPAGSRCGVVSLFSSPRGFWLLHALCTAGFRGWGVRPCSTRLLRRPFSMRSPALAAVLHDLLPSLPRTQAELPNSSRQPLRA